MHDRLVHTSVLFGFFSLGSLCEASLSRANFTDRNVEGRKQNPFSDQGQKTLTIMTSGERIIG